MQILCPWCLSLAQEAIINKEQEVDLLECTECGRLWPEHDHLRFWEQLQIEKEK
jgi:hypothetical protein